MPQTCQSDVGQLRTVFLKSVAEGFLNQEAVDSQWQALNYLDRPSYPEAVAEYASFVNILRQAGCEVTFFNEDERTSMDSIYCRDASIATDHGLVLCNMGKGQRLGEPLAQGEIFEHHGLKILGRIKDSGTLEGGDVTWLDQHTLAVGHTYRSNMEGFRQLKTLLAPHDIQLVQVPLPHYKGPDDVFHLMSIFSPIDKDLAVVYAPLMPIIFRNLLIEKGYVLIEVPDEEWDSMGCNVLALAPRTCVMVAGNHITRSRLESAGCTVHEYAGQHISVMGGGGPTCLTRPIIREL